MENKVVGMIRFLKHNYANFESLRETAIAYMMEYSGCERSTYTDGVIEPIIFEVFCDFMDTVDKPSIHLRQMRESAKINQMLRNNYNVYDAMLSAMFMVQVREHGEYINGFCAEDFES